MALPTKFTFKTTRPTGRYASFDSSIHDIKLKKIVCGQIGDGTPYKIRFQVKKKDINEDGNLNCKWKWITLSKESKTLQEAKDYVNERFKVITTQFDIWIDKD